MRSSSIARRIASYQDVLAVARSAAADALPHQAEFIRRGLASDFLEDLQADIDELEAAISRQAQSTEAHIAATAAIDAQIERGVMAVRQLDPFMRNTFAADPATLAAWMSASHIERTPRRPPQAPENAPRPTAA